MEETPKVIDMEKKETELSLHEHGVDDLQEKSTNICAAVIGCFCLPLTLCYSLYTLREREEAVILRWGTYEKTETTPGIHFSNCVGRDLIKVFKSKQAHRIPSTTIADSNGIPLVVSGIVTFFFENTKAFALNVANPEQFVKDQAQAVMKQIVSRYPYDSKDGASLKSEPINICHEYVDSLQKLVQPAGAKIISFQFDELTVAGDVASIMLKKQQAQMTLEARELLVKGAVSICQETIESLESKGIHIDNQQKGYIVGNLLTVLVSDKEATPTLPLKNNGTY